MRLIFAVFLSLVSVQANALLISTDGWYEGDGLLTSDTATGLSWLDLTVTNDMSFTDVFITDSYGLLDLGFIAPSISDVETLFYNAGAPHIGPLPGGCDGYDAETFEDAQTFISLFGCTSCRAPYSEGYIISETNGARFGYAETKADGIGGFGMSTRDQFSYDSAFRLTHHQTGAGFFLVIDTSDLDGLFPGLPPASSDDSTVSAPEPATLALMSLGLAGLGLSCSKKKIIS